jgi:hypothetical protein
MVDSEAKARDRIFRFGTIKCGTGPSVVSVVRNLSTTGATLELKRAFRVPNEFTLIVEGYLFGRTCRVVWRESKRVGVEFV